MLSFHPAADAFPLMDARRHAELVQDIRVNGQIEAITLCDGMVLDGRNRYRACVEIGIAPNTKEFRGDPWAYTWSLNGMRRDLVDEQRYLIWKYCNEQSETFVAEKQRIAEESNRKRSEATKERPRNEDGTMAVKPVVGHSVLPLDKVEPGKTAKASAAKVNLGSVARGDKLAKDRPDLAAAVRKGEMRPAEAHREMKKAEHKEKLAAPAPVSETGKYEIVLADPPWRYDHQQAGNRSVENNYPTATSEEIESHVPQTEDNAILFLWATAPKLEQALRVVSAWGFSYVTSAVWDKEKIGMGYWFRGQHELLLVAVKGAPGTVPECERRSSVFKEARTAHSKKPLCVYEWIERAFPDRTKLEMYCREPRQGWSCWGNEV